MKFNDVGEALQHLADLMGEPVEFGGPDIPDHGHGYHLVQYRIMWNSVTLPDATAEQVTAAIEAGDIESHFGELDWDYPIWNDADSNHGILVDALDEDGNYDHEHFYSTAYGTFHPKS